uniref:Uncharacterized protein n=1 Tax=Anguilla anguilla TaxID=7936 RepID=A0A0E9QX47_ANGAN
MQSHLLLCNGFAVASLAS